MRKDVKKRQPHVVSLPTFSSFKGSFVYSAQIFALWAIAQFDQSSQISTSRFRSARSCLDHDLIVNPFANFSVFSKTCVHDGDI